MNCKERERRNLESLPPLTSTGYSVNKDSPPQKSTTLMSAFWVCLFVFCLFYFFFLEESIAEIQKCTFPEQCFTCARNRIYDDTKQLLKN